MFSSLTEIGEHPIARMYAAYHRDPNQNKTDLGIGVYRDAEGRSPIMECVRIAERRLLEKRATKAYLTPVGNISYLARIHDLIFGDGHCVLRDNRICAVQTPGAGGALRLSGELIKAVSPSATIWISSPAWEFQPMVFKAAGLSIAEYPYYNTQTNTLQFDEMISTLNNAKPGDAVLLQACCHNPTGEDLSKEQWRALARFLSSKRLTPVIDLVYAGLGDSLEEDLFSTRLMAEQTPEMLVASSSSKSFSIYRDRAGALSVITSRNSSNQHSVGRLLAELSRSLYFMPPDSGAEIVAEILGDEELTELWHSELDAMRGRVQELRNNFYNALMLEKSNVGFDFIRRQKGMFSLLPLTPSDLLTLEEKDSIYMMPDARINIAALTPDKITPVANAICRVLAEKHA